MPIFPTHLYADPVMPPSGYPRRRTACGKRVRIPQVIYHADELAYVSCQACRRTKAYRNINPNPEPAVR